MSPLAGGSVRERDGGEEKERLGVNFQCCAAFFHMNQKDAKTEACRADFALTPSSALESLQSFPDFVLIFDIHLFNDSD